MMIPIKHLRDSYRHGVYNTMEWQDAYLIAVLPDQHASDGVAFVITYPDGSHRGSEHGMIVAKEKHFQHIRIKRTRIPLLDAKELARAV